MQESQVILVAPKRWCVGQKESTHYCSTFTKCASGVSPRKFVKRARRKPNQRLFYTLLSIFGKLKVLGLSIAAMQRPSKIILKFFSAENRKNLLPISAWCSSRTFPLKKHSKCQIFAGKKFAQVSKKTNEVRWNRLDPLLWSYKQHNDVHHKWKF